MRIFKNFFECYFCQTFSYEDLDTIIQDIKQPEHDDYAFKFIIELHAIIQTKNYKLASKLIKKYSGRVLSLEKTEKFINFLYDKLIDRPTAVEAQDFKRNCKAILCPLCCPPKKKLKILNIIDKATIIKNNQQIYICKPCKAVWASEDIRADNAQNYKTFMKSIGFKGFWTELRDIDIY